MEWSRRALTNYMHVRTGKGKIEYWRELVGRRDAGCRRCGAYLESGDLVAFQCSGRAQGRRWASWADMETEERSVEAEL